MAMPLFLAHSMEQKHVFWPNFILELCHDRGFHLRIGDNSLNSHAQITNGFGSSSGHRIRNDSVIYRPSQHRWSREAMMSRDTISIGDAISTNIFWFTYASMCLSRGVMPNMSWFGGTMTLLAGTMAILAGTEPSSGLSW
jgi:hypothetical protein